jgi:PAS domain S-box-containing protein
MKLLSTKPDRESKKQYGEIRELLHELEVHQVELEITNEELRSTQEELRLSRDRFQELYDCAPVGYVTLNQNGLILEANATAARMFGVEQGKLIHRGLDRFIALGDRDPFISSCREISSGRLKRRFELRLNTGAEPAPYVQIDCLPQKTRDATVIRCSLTDITERKIAEDKVTDVSDALAMQSANLSQAFDEMEAFSYSVSHDLRAPLRALSGFSEALLEDHADELKDDARKYLERIRAAAQRMNGLIDDLLKLSRISRVDLKLTEVNVSQIAQKIADNLQEREPERNVKFTITSDIKMLADPQMLEIVLQNLLDNAWKFTANKPDAEIRLSVTNTGTGPALFVKDNGAGFDPQYAERMFTPFQRLHAQTEYSGSGIGLAIVRRIVQRHGGTIWAKGSPGKGSTFYFTLAEKPIVEGGVDVEQ